MKEFKSCNTEAISGLKNYMNSHQTIIDILKIWNYKKTENLYSFQ